MIKEIWIKLKEAFMSVMPIMLIVAGIVLFVTPVKTEMVITFLISSVLLILGMAFFNVGADQSMIPMGSSIGQGLSQTKKLSIMLISALVIGFIITFAEPDLSVLAEQSGMGKWLFICMVSLGVGIFLLLAVIKTVFQIKLNVMLAISYGLIFILSIFVPENFLPLCFDSGSVTTGPISVPFLIAFGLGLATIRSSQSSEDDSFGLIALSSAGPILSVMLMVLFFGGNIQATEVTSETLTIGSALLTNFVDVFIILLPIFLIFLVFNFVLIKLPASKIWRISIGLIITYLGIVLFLTGVTAGYLPLATKIGAGIMESGMEWILYPLSLLLGYFVISAEPAVHVLKKQVEEITAGRIKQKTILIVISIGVSLAVFLATMRILFDINILFILLPIYLIAIILSFINPVVFSGIAFDAGGTATGAMAVSFILPFLTGVMGNGGGAFGTIALIACMPILSLQVLGLIYTIGVKRAERKEIVKTKHVEIIDFEF